MDELNLVNFRMHPGPKYSVLPIKKVEKIVINFEKYDCETVKKELKEHIKPNQINLISNENIWWNSYESVEKRRKRIVAIKNCFPNAKILFGIREKQDLLLSLYKKYVIKGGILDFSGFQKNIVSMEQLNYEIYIELLNELFGEENVFVYDFENINRNISDHVKNICDFISVKYPNFNNVKRNIGYSLWQLKISLLLNHLFRNDLNPNGIIPLHYKLHPHRIIFQSNIFPRILRGEKVNREKLFEKKI